MCVCVREREREREGERETWSEDGETSGVLTQHKLFQKQFLNVLLTLDRESLGGEREGREGGEREEREREEREGRGGGEREERGRREGGEESDGRGRREGRGERREGGRMEGGREGGREEEYTWHYKEAEMHVGRVTSLASLTPSAIAK